MATIYRGTATSVPASLGGSIPGDAATGHVLRDVAPFVENLAPQNTPILDRVMRGNRGRRPGGLRANQYKAEWGTEANLPHTATLEGAITSSATSITVEAGQGARFQKYMKIAVYDLDGNSLPDSTTKEEMWLSAEPSTDTLTVVRARGGTTGRAFLDGARIEIIGVATPEGQDFTVAPAVWGDFYFNYYQLYQKSAKVTLEANVTPTVETNEREMARQMRQKTMRLKLELEKNLVQGGRAAGNISTPTPFEMGGIGTFIPSANTTNASGEKIGPYDIEVAGAALWDSVGDAAAKTLLMNMRTARFFDGLMNRYKQANMNDTSVNLTMTTFQTRVGTYNIEPTRWMLDGEIWGVNFEHIHLVPYEGMNWQEKEHATDGAYLQRSIFGRFTTVVEAPEVLFRIYGFNTDINAYGRVF